METDILCMEPYTNVDDGKYIKLECINLTMHSVDLFALNGLHFYPYCIDEENYGFNQNLLINTLSLSSG